MTPLTREDIQILSKHSNLSDEQVAQLLEVHVHPSKLQWQKLLRILMLSLAIGFSAAGLIFFFAYNWSHLHKFAKLGIVQALLISTVLLALRSGFSSVVKNIFLSGASILVGALFAVFGQIYQSGANAYDFFLGWTVFTTIWVVTANFAALWLLFLLLVNVTLNLFINQMQSGWQALDLLFLHFGVNALAVFIAVAVGKERCPTWFLYTLAVALSSITTAGLIIGLFDENSEIFLPFFICALALYALGVYYANKIKNTLYIALVALSLIFFIAALLIKNTEDLNMIFITGVFVIAAITFCVKLIIDLQKKWQHEN